MLSFQTPRPVEVQILAAHVVAELTAAEEATATVALLDDDGPPLEQILDVGLDGGRLFVHERRGTQKALGGRRLGVRVAVPAGSGLEVQSATTTITAAVALGDVELTLNTATVELVRVDGRAKVTCAGGAVRIGELRGDLAVQASSCDVTVGRSDAELDILVAGGDVRLGEVRRGSARVETSSGRIDVGVATGTVAWLDAESKHGTVENHLTTQDDPDGFTEQASLRLKTRTGAIEVRRA